MSAPELDPTPADDLVRYAMSNYETGDVLRSWAAEQGIENRNYFVQTGSRTHMQNYVLTFLNQPANSGDAYAEMMQCLDRAGLPVAAPLPNRQQQHLSDVEGTWAMLQRCLPGSHTINPTLRQIRALARFVARMHITLAEGAHNMPAYPRNASWLQTTSNTLHPHLAFLDQALMQQVVGQVQSLLQRQDVGQLPQGTIHGDLFRDNVLFNEHGLTGVLDFHHASHGFWIYDLAVIANDWCNDAHGCLDPDRTMALLRAYHQVRPLWPEEVWFFPQFALYAALSFWMSRSLQAIAQRTDASIRTKDPQEFRRIVAHHNRHALYLDLRKLDA